jgi:3-oxoacyl-[acyl-carrier protein] reductase
VDHPLTDRPQDFAGKVAIVTGGTRGIGFGIAEELVARGARVIITARKPDELAAATERLGGPQHALAARGSADDAEHQAAAVEQAVAAFGSLDLLVNNAAINPLYGRVIDADLVAVRKTFEVNITACLAWTQLAYRAWMQEHGGNVLNVASIGGIRAGAPIGIYNTSKAALIHLTRVLAGELGPTVRVNAIAPAVVKTDFARALYERDEEGVASRYPMKRLGAPQDCASAAAFLLSDAASWITGECLVVDGGITSAG